MTRRLPLIGMPYWERRLNNETLAENQSAQLTEGGNRGEAKDTDDRC